MNNKVVYKTLNISYEERKIFRKKISEGSWPPRIPSLKEP